MHEICGVVLAGGKSRRMGSDKAQLILGARTFLERILDSMEGIFPERLVVGRPEPAPWMNSGKDTIFVQDIRKDCGPLGGMYTALLICRNPWALFVSCDTPLLDRPVYEKVCDAVDPEGRHIVLVGTTSGAWGNFPILVPKTYLRTIRRLLDLGECSIKGLVQNAMTTVLSLPHKEEEKIRSVNTPTEYEALLRKHHALVA